MSQLTTNTTTIDECIALANSLPDAGSSGGGNVETCTVTVTLGSAATLFAYATTYLNGVISATDYTGNSLSEYVLENVVCGSMFALNTRYYTSVPAYTLGNGVTEVHKGNGIFCAPTQAGVNGTVHIIDDM